MPRQTPDSIRWNGPLRALGEYKERYAADEVHYTDELNEVVKNLNLRTVYVLEGFLIPCSLSSAFIVGVVVWAGVNSDSGLKSKLDPIKALAPEVLAAAGMKVDKETLFPVLCEARVHKTLKEMELLRTAELVSAQAHYYVMKHTRPGAPLSSFSPLYCF